MVHTINGIVADTPERVADLLVLGLSQDLPKHWNSRYTAVLRPRLLQWLRGLHRHYTFTSLAFTPSFWGKRWDVERGDRDMVVVKAGWVNEPPKGAAINDLEVWLK